MKDIILKAENISKQYRLGQVGTGTMAHDLNRWWHQVRGKENPYLKIGDTNDRSTKGTSDYVWALQDINFEVERGEILGIIGKNGAGKSTLLKILSRVTAPTTGSIKFGGRVASLLEVGTGFNGEMTGRENIYLNGAILGMTKKEITSKIDEIIDFSGCERYIDTPVKRYSSGMYVRLAFAVAAFLEPEILIVDEVLAVGDAEFQKKAIGKMQDISRTGGRTVLFVSHNMAAVKSLCTRGIVLENGQVVFDGGIEESVDLYHNASSNFESFYKRDISKDFSEIVIDEININNEGGNLESRFYYDQNIVIDFKLNSKFEIKDNNRYKMFCTIVSKNGQRVCSYETNLIKSEKIRLTIEAEFLVRGEYFLNAFIHVPQQLRIDEVNEVCLFEILDEKSSLSIHGLYNYGQVFGKGKWDSIF
ncbi:polysaccharide ABC transporter ATP-binding protein [Flavobacterium sp. LS1R10]|uniref:ABC transporter ATP-binding protein n=1 Tax=Flavobacterium sp. LS1R10 TaxID=2497482 RepID=UPI000F83C869|nr:ABC transporter ATP-binding protein [Flavobacterium sp. LS1R10]RTY76859.1 ATP-binding cassette domain-containing protein [Flavobacterium sp. LS1R10]